MFCKKCGGEIKLGEKFCPNCGTSCEGEFVTNQSISNQSAFSMGQAPIQQSVNQSTVYSLPKQAEGKKKDFVFIIVIVVIGLALIAIPIILNFNKLDFGQGAKESNKDSSVNSNSTVNPNPDSNSDLNTNTNTNNSNLNINTNSNTNTNTNTNTNSNNVTDSTATLGNYIFSMPPNARIQIEDESLYFDHLRGAEDMGTIAVQTGSYDQLKKSKELIKQNMESSEYIVESVTIETYNGVEFIVIPVSQGEIKAICGFTKLSNTEFAMIMVMKSDFTMDKTLLNEMASIIKKAKRAGATGM